VDRFDEISVEERSTAGSCDSIRANRLNTLCPMFIDLGERERSRKHSKKSSNKPSTSLLNKSGPTRRRGCRRSSRNFSKPPTASSTPLRVAGGCCEKLNSGGSTSPPITHTFHFRIMQRIEDYLIVVRDSASYFQASAVTGLAARDDLAVVVTSKFTRTQSCRRMLVTTPRHPEKSILRFTKGTHGSDRYRSRPSFSPTSG